MNFKFLLPLLVLTGVMYGETPVDGLKKVFEQKKAVPPDDTSGKYAATQYEYGVFCKEKLKDDAKAYHYLELAAKQNYRDAWVYLGSCYAMRSNEHPSFLLWAKLCYMAAQKIKFDPKTEFAIGAVEGLSGNEKEFYRRMKIAADGGSKEAAGFLADKALRKAIAEKGKTAAGAKTEALGQAVSSHLDKLARMMGSSDQEKKVTTAEKKSVAMKMITLPLPEKLRLPEWKYDAEATEREVAQNLMSDRHGDMRWMTEEFKTQPLWENLLYPNPTIRAINYAYHEAVEESLKKSAFRMCSKAETKRLTEFFHEKGMPADYFKDDQIWDLGKGVYFRIHVAVDGAWRLRDYQFFVVRDGSCIELVTSSTPPSAKEAATVIGAAWGNNDCLNNLAVQYVAGERDNFANGNPVAEKYFQILAGERHAAGTYNLAIFYREQKKKEESDKYFRLAEKFAGSSVISPALHLPEIFDRNGELLVKNRLNRTSQESARIFLKGGTFASTLIGHISTFNRDTFDRYDVDGISGIERIIVRKKITHPVFLTMDSALQKELEKVIHNVSGATKPRYAYGVIVSSKGELVAAAQDIVYDEDKGEFADKDRWNFMFMPAGYLLPVPDSWMKLLGSASLADPKSKEKFQFHIKQGVFADEARGIVLGLNRYRNYRSLKQVAGQAATMLNYVHAYIGTAEKKPIPRLTVYTDKANTPLKPAKGIQWISFYRPPDGIVVNALGVIKTADPDVKLYVCLRSVYEERNFKKPLNADAVRSAAARGDKAEKIIKGFPFTSGK